VKDEPRDSIKAAFEAELAESPPPADLRRRVIDHPFEPGEPTMVPWKILAAVASVLLAAAISGTLLVWHLNAAPAGDRRQPPVATTPTATSTPSPSPSATPSPTPPASSPAPSPEPTAVPVQGSGMARCDVNDLRLSRGTVGAAAGNVAFDFIFTNVSGSTCYLYGFPGMQMMDSAGKPLLPTPSRNGGQVIADNVPHRVDLAPGATASFTVGSVDPGVVQGGCPVSASVVVTPPDSYNHFTIPASIADCANPYGPYISPVVAGSQGDHR
jgi:Protein of unknown function (DUF4232)